MTPEETLEEMKADIRKEITDLGAKGAKRKLLQHKTKYFASKQKVDKMKPSPKKDEWKQHHIYAKTEIDLYEAELAKSK